MGRYAVGKLDWNRCDFKCRRNVERVAEERTLAGRLFQMAEAAVRKLRVPNDKLHRVSDNRLAEADCMGCAGGAGWLDMEDYRY